MHSNSFCQRAKEIRFPDKIRFVVEIEQTEE
jgi:hypothetical protein